MILTILGCHAATPKISSHPTSQVLEIRNHQFLIDCGEGTQIQLRRYKIRFSRIKHIFISHLHGDHFFGLPGLISTFHLMGRETEIHIYGPKGIKEAILLLLKLGSSYTKFQLYFHELDSKEPQVIFEDDQVTVETIPLIHRVYTNGFLFKEKPGERKLNIDAARQLDIDLSYYQRIKKGDDVPNNEGKLISNSLITFDPDPPKSYAYCSDTAFNEEMVQQIKGATALYHESTFLEIHQDLAVQTKHSTAREAATIARKSGVKTLILGHYSGRYRSPELFRQEAVEVFQNVQLAEDGKVFSF